MSPAPAYRCACTASPLAQTQPPGLGRRGFLGALALAGCATPPSAEGAWRVDVHHHISPPAWVAALKKSKLDSPPVNDWTPQRSLDDMDRAGVRTALTSPTLPAVGFLPAAEAAAVARAANEYARSLAQRHPGRFGCFALLPMPHVDATLAEIGYALDVLKCDGVALMTSYDGKFLGDPAFAPVTDELHRRKATAYTHPNEPACCRNLSTGVPSVIIEYGTDTTRSIASLIFSGTASRCRDIQFIFSHAGGTVTALTERFNTQAVALPQFKAAGFGADSVNAALRQFHYDTAQTANPIAMGALRAMVPLSQIVFGTDYPYRSALEHVRGLASIFSPAELAQIGRGNAQRLMPGLPG